MRIPKIPEKWIQEIQEDDKADLDNICVAHDILSPSWLESQLKRNETHISIMVLWVLSLRNGFPVGVPTITHKMSLLAHPIYSKDILNILPWIISQVPDGDVKILIQSQMLDKRAKFFTDFIILSGPTGSGKSSILGTFEQKDGYIIVPVFTTREWSHKEGSQ